MTVATNGAAAFMCTFSPSLLNFLNEQLDSLPLKFQMTLIVTDTMLLSWKHVAMKKEIKSAHQNLTL
jgi:hypothetical protein